jgi:hypothetical protein
MVFLRGQIGPCPAWLTELDVSAEVAAIEENWIKPGKMLSWHNVTDGFPIIGPPFQGMTEDQGLTLWFYSFPTFELSKEWAIGAPEHIAIHTRVLEALQKRAALAGAETVQPGNILPSYSFHATDAPRDQIPAMRAELRELYQQIEASDWAGVPAGTVQLMMLGNH